ncbi:pyruvate formate-lyase-activating protein [Lachnobacterium bovis]|jgi:pyruvate formate lyase activating enzyme|uniref:Pyruvate formate-lyase-activating enzyme n=1 Tax=Lachnobacterium bovis DSM 14045 TaxID=1122142 RepID=A0A1H3LQT1_9FIRM|nr:pyruvate formate-lyase-activating protein [Lachnobacterium bovis]MBQ1802495.1 pyruvate formate lyase-activating protein [Lachnobacterium sp.]SDY66792.1 pyruvate formate lyase activating enzyme [Lachnobacterium bovis DSM 14045]
MSNLIGKINKLETFGLVDGPGVRYVVFLQGCSMKCKYCHNPETWYGSAPIEMTPEQLYKKALRYKTYWKNNGGITVSGGEALLQLDFVTELFELAKKDGIHTAIDTSGNPFKMNEEYLEKFNRLMRVTDLFILDLKEINNKKHIELTSQPNDNILQMAQYLSKNNKKMWIRHVLVPNLTDNEADLKKMDEFIRSLNTVTRVEVLPYHTLGVPKWEKLGRKYPLEGYKIPTKEQITKAEDILRVDSFPEKA